MLEHLSKRSRLLVAVVAVFLTLIYFVPMWNIHLVAPQYPEGMGMHIWVNKITGWAAHDLQNINLLNHYVGMAPIVEESIPELLYMPYILGFMILGAVVTFFFARRIMIYLGILNFFAVGAAGLYDFWRWEYNYGHNLNPDAPITIPGMSYQPPLIGYKTLLNITASSWPGLGGILLFASVGILLFILWSERKRHA